jgi:hypothetical protein
MAAIRFCLATSFAFAVLLCVQVCRSFSTEESSFGSEIRLSIKNLSKFSLHSPFASVCSVQIFGRVTPTHLRRNGKSGGVHFSAFRTPAASYLLTIIFPELRGIVLNRHNPVGVDDLLVTAFRASRSCFLGFFRAVSFTDDLNACATFTAPSGDRRHYQGHKKPGFIPAGAHYATKGFF